MEKFNFDSVLNRTYPLGNFVWSSSDAEGTMLHRSFFPDDLFSQTFIADKIKNFQYFRGGVEFTIRIVSQQFMYGKLICTAVPMWQYKGNKPSIPLVASGDFTATGWPHVLVSASSGEAVTIRLPFYNDKRALRIGSYSSGEIGAFTISVLNGLIDANTGSACTAGVFVTASFIDAEMMLPFAPQSSKEKVKKESKKKSESGTISSILDQTDALAATMEYFPPAAPFASVYRMASKPASMLAHMAGLSKPTTTAVTQVGKINPYMDVNYGKGLDASLKFAVDPDNGVAVQPIGGVNIDEMDLKYIAMTPMMVTYLAVSQSQLNTRLTLWEINDTDATYFNYLKRFFKFWSGGLNKVVYYSF